MEIKIVDWNIEPLHVIDGGIFQEKCFITWKESCHIAIIISYVDEWRHLEKTKEGKERKKIDNMDRFEQCEFSNTKCIVSSPPRSACRMSRLSSELQKKKNQR